MRISTTFLLVLFLPLWGVAQETGKFLPKEVISENDTLKYRILYPKDFSKNQEYPLVLFLHGAGERGDDNKAQLTHGSELFLENEEFPAIVVFPQCPAEDYWASVNIGRSDQGNRFEFDLDAGPTEPLSLVMDLMDDLLKKDYVKQEQVYVAGLSMGGMGTFEILARMPDTFAAAIPICGGGDLDGVANYAENTELWIFHGARDNVVPQELSIEMANAINAAGGMANLTIYGAANHNSWDRAFAEPNFLNWLFSKSKQPGETSTAN